MDIPRSTIEALLNLKPNLIAEIGDTDIMAAKQDLKRRLEGGSRWEHCIVEAEHGMVLLLPGDEANPVQGIHYRTPSCGSHSSTAEGTASMLSLLGVQTPVGTLYRAIVTQYGRIVVRGINTDSPRVETL